MSIGHYIKEIGRGKEGARALSREQAADLMGQVLDGTVSDMALGAFCIAMRIKGETAQEMAGFLDALQQRMNPIALPATAAVVLPCYNGARKLPALTALLAVLLSQRGLAVLVHGSTSESARITTSQVLTQLGMAAAESNQALSAGLQAGRIVHVHPQCLHPGLHRLLETRRVIGLRSSAHSMVKLMQPLGQRGLLVTSYTHPEYLASMSDTLKLTQTNALLLRGTEGEPVADIRRTPAMDQIFKGQLTRVQDMQAGSLQSVPELPAIDAASTARWIERVANGQVATPAAIDAQVQHIVNLAGLLG